MKGCHVYASVRLASFGIWGCEAAFIGHVSHFSMSTALQRLGTHIHLSHRRHKSCSWQKGWDAPEVARQLGKTHKDTGHNASQVVPQHLWGFQTIDDFGDMRMQLTTCFRGVGTPCCCQHIDILSGQFSLSWTWKESLPPTRYFSTQLYADDCQIRQCVQSYL